MSNLKRSFDNESDFSQKRVRSNVPPNTNSDNDIPNVIDFILNGGVIDVNIYNFIMSRKHKILSHIPENHPFYTDLLNTENLRIEFINNQNNFNLNILSNNRIISTMTDHIQNMLRWNKECIQKGGEDFISGILNSDHVIDEESVQGIGELNLFLENENLVIEQYFYEENVGERINKIYVNINNVNRVFLAENIRYIFTTIMSL